MQNSYSIHPVRTIVKKYLVGSTQDVLVYVNIVQGSQTFAAGLLEKETVDFEVSIDLLDAGSKQLLVSTGGTATFQVKSWDASHDFINKLFDKAISASIYKAMEKRWVQENSR